MKPFPSHQDILQLHHWPASELNWKKTTEVQIEKVDNWQKKETLVQAMDSESIKPVRSDFPGRAEAPPPAVRHETE